jgi:divalent metal cation (Fe/Co/Zn/Cd) transporter
MEKFFVGFIAFLLVVGLDLVVSAFYWYAFNNWTNLHPTFILVLLVSSFISISSYHYQKKG